MFAIEYLDKYNQSCNYFNGFSKSRRGRIILKEHKSDYIRKKFKMWKNRETAEKWIEKIKNTICDFDDYNFKVINVEEDDFLMKWINTR